MSLSCLRMQRRVYICMCHHVSDRPPCISVQSSKFTTASIIFTVVSTGLSSYKISPAAADSMLLVASTLDHKGRRFLSRLNKLPADSIDEVLSDLVTELGDLQLSLLIKVEHQIAEGSKAASNGGGPSTPAQPQPVAQVEAFAEETARQD